MEHIMAYNSIQSDGLAQYIKFQGNGAQSIDFEVVKSFVNSGANPLVCRAGDGANLFGIASSAKWISKHWLGLIDICIIGKVTPDEFTNGLANYLKFQENRRGIDLEVVKAFVNNGANPLVLSGDGCDLFKLASYNKWSTAHFLDLIKIVNLYEHCIKPSPSVPISKTFIQEFDQEFDALSALIDPCKKKTNSLITIEQISESAHIAGAKLLKCLAKHRSDYQEGKITLDEFRTYCGAYIKVALQSDLAKQPVIYRALVSFLNLIVGLTLVIPVATKITTGRWGLFSNSETQGEKHLRKMADNLRGLTESENNVPEPISLSQFG